MCDPRGHPPAGRTGRAGRGLIILLTSYRIHLTLAAGQTRSPAGARPRIEPARLVGIPRILRVGGTVTPPRQNAPDGSRQRTPTPALGHDRSRRRAGRPDPLRSLAARDAAPLSGRLGAVQPADSHVLLGQSRRHHLGRERTRHAGPLDHLVSRDEDRPARRPAANTLPQGHRGLPEAVHAPAPRTIATRGPVLDQRPSSPCRMATWAPPSSCSS